MEEGTRDRTTKTCSSSKFWIFVFGTVAVTLFRVAQGMGWALRPGEKWEKYSVETNPDRSNVIVGTLVGLFVSNLVFSAACLLRLDFASIEALHGTLCAFLYTATGFGLIDNAKHTNSLNGESFVFASGFVCLLLGFSYAAVVLFFAWKELFGAIRECRY
ncbi:unnamed protein product [Darwinula stevensoni]|uniref:Uncharacterized protein n=1 Tax=Darwinula stevensoni TaxID=69355 RepID=A0A7R8X9R3_9CRUS|nr:unnamed protein product [Darwinula stevensoni]CAG0882787.1 unnamed protein product [Darwinula stevensoni]